MLIQKNKYTQNAGLLIYRMNITNNNIKGDSNYLYK
jgi:hypothetical protein